jgi:hypothetical protein
MLSQSIVQIVAQPAPLTIRHLTRLHKAIASFDVISDAMPFGRLWYVGPEAAANATGYVKFYSRSHQAVIRVYDEAGNLIEAHKHAGDLRKS